MHVNLQYHIRTMYGISSLHVTIWLVSDASQVLETTHNLYGGNILSTTSGICLYFEIYNNDNGSFGPHHGIGFKFMA